ncbi:MAG TPA: phage tail tape measure protein [bacterium]|nr:phage tail tape measure protein [bacterium]
MLIDRLHYALGLDTSGLKSGAMQAHGLLGMLDGKMAGLAKGAGILAIGSALAGIGIKATKMAAELDAAMGEVWSITDKTAKQMEKITADILDLSKRVPESAVGLIKAYYQILSAGVTDTAKALNVLEVSSKAATAGLTTTFTVVDAITNILNAYNIESSESARISDELFTAVRDGKVTMEQLAPAIGAVVGTASLAKVELKEVLAAIVAMTLSGYSVDESATSINRFLLSIVDTQDDAKKAAKELGIEWSVAGMQARGFENFIRDLNEKAGDNIEVLQSIVPEIRSFRAAAVIAGTGADAYARSLDNLKNSAGATDQALNKIMDDVAMQWKVEKNRLNAAFTELGQKILPVVKDGLQIINDLFQKVGLAGSTAAERLQKEWQGVATTISTVADITTRLDVLQKSVTLLLTPGPDVEKNLAKVKEMFNAYPALTAEAKAVQGDLEASSVDLLSALHTEIDYLKKAAEESKKIGLEERQRLITVKELQKYQQQTEQARQQAKKLGMTAEYEKLSGILERLKETEKAWTIEKRIALMDMNRGAAEQIQLTKAFETAGDNVKNLQTELLADTNRLMVSDEKLVELERIRLSIANKAKEAREDEHAEILKMLKALEAMQRVKAWDIYQWMPQSAIQTTDRGGGLPYGAMPMPKTSNLRVYDNKLKELWDTFFYGEDAAENLTSSAHHLADALFEGDKAMQQATRGSIDLFEGIYAKNPVGVISGIIDIFSSFMNTSEEVIENVYKWTRAMEEFNEGLEEMTFQQLTDLYQKMWTTLVDRYGNFTRNAKGQYTDEQRKQLDEALDNFGKWGDDFAGMIQRWNYEVQVLNIEDPIEKFQRLVRYAKQYLGIDLPTEVEDGMAKVKMFIESLGAGVGIEDAWRSAFGMALPREMTAEQLRELIELYQDSLGEIKEWREETAAEATVDEESVAFSRTKQITYRQAEEMTLALWSIHDLVRNIYSTLSIGLAGQPMTIPEEPAGPTTTPANQGPDFSEIISKLNLYVTNCYVSTSNALVDVVKAQVYIGATSFVPDTYGGLIFQESDRVLRSQGTAWPT